MGAIEFSCKEFCPYLNKSITEKRPCAANAAINLNEPAYAQLCRDEIFTKLERIRIADPRIKSLSADTEGEILDPHLAIYANRPEGATAKDDDKGILVATIHDGNI